MTSNLKKKTIYIVFAMKKNITAAMLRAYLSTAIPV
jgi:hypothetical protein